MSDVAYTQAPTRDETRALFGQTMGLVAITTAFFAVGAYLGRDMSYGMGWLWFIGAIVVLFGLQAAVAKSEQLAIALLFVFGIVTIFVRIPNGALIYSVLGLVIFAGFTMVDFQRLRKAKDIRVAPLLAASIFLDVLNVFLFFLNIFGRR